MIISYKDAKEGETYVVVDKDSHLFGSTLIYSHRLSSSSECHMLHTIVDGRYENIIGYAFILNNNLESLINIKDGVTIDKVEFGKKYVAILGEKDMLTYATIFAKASLAYNKEFFHSISCSAYNTRDNLNESNLFYIVDNPRHYTVRFIPLERTNILVDYSVGF